MNEQFAKGVNERPPWWATAPIWLAAGIVGVPSLMAIGMGYFVASSVTARLASIDHTNQTQIHLLTEHMNDQKKNADILIKFMDDNLKAQYQTCINTSQNPQERMACLSPEAREKAYGLIKKK